jgi:hypothetical protein
MSVNSITATAQEQTLSAIRTAQEAVVTALKPVVALSEPLFDNARVPFADRLPSPTEAVEQWYGFAADALASQKEFSLSLIGLLPPVSGAGKTGSESA